MLLVGLSHYYHWQKEASLSQKLENVRDIFRQSFTMELCRTALFCTAQGERKCSELVNSQK